MKRIKNILLVSAAALSLAACRQQIAQPEPPTPFDHTIRVATTVNGLQAGYTTDNLKTFDLMVDNPTNISYRYPNMRFTKDDQGNWSNSPEIASEILFENDTQPVNVVAFAPNDSYGEGSWWASDIDYPVSVETDQSSSDKLDRSDFIVCKRKGFVPKNDLINGKVSLNFKHMMANLILTVKNTSSAASSYKVELSSLYIGGNCDFSKDSPTVTGSTKGTISSKVTAGQSVQFFIFPQTFNKYEFTITLIQPSTTPLRKEIYHYPSSIQFKGGTSYTFTLTNPYALSLESIKPFY